MIIGCSKGISEDFRTTADRKIGSCRKGAVLGDGIKPVRVGIQVRIITIICLQYLIIGKWFLVWIRLKVVEQGHILCRSDKLRKFGRSLHGLLDAEIN